jgi:hypothetical protein
LADEPEIVPWMPLFFDMWLLIIFMMTSLLFDPYLPDTAFSKLFSLTSRKYDLRTALLLSASETCQNMAVNTMCILCPTYFNGTIAIFRGLVR